jgi:hypothetical protein
MTEWWTYGLSDFLMFSPQAYWRLVARYNQWGWPAHLAAQAAALALPALLARDSVAARRCALVLLAVAWAWVGWAFHWQRYAEIFLGAPYLAVACGVQALLLLAAACLPWRGVPASSARATGLVLAAAAAVYPLLAPLTGHALEEAEVFGWMPDPTALATLGALGLLPMPGRWRAALCALPLLSLALGIATRRLLA